MAMPDEDPQKIKEIRRFSAIYGRFDAKRKPEKPLTLHEVCSMCISFCNILPFYILQCCTNSCTYFVNIPMFSNH